MISATSRVRIAAATALGLAALGVAAPLLAVGPAQPSATGNCLAWLGSRDDGQCISYSNGSPTYIGTPNFGIWGPSNNGGLGISSGPLLPGTTINQGIGN